MAMQWNGSYRIYSNGATTSIWSQPSTGTGNLYVQTGSGWVQASAYYACISYDLIRGSTWVLVASTDKYSPVLAPESVSIVVQPYAPLRNRLIIDWTDPAGPPSYVNYTMNITWQNYDAESRGDYSKTGGVSLPPGRSSPHYVASDVGDSGDHVAVSMWYTDSVGIAGLSHDQTVNL